MEKWISLVALTVISIWTTQAGSAEYPTLGTLTGEIEHHGLQYKCELEASQTLSCQFTQISISTLKEASDWPEEKQKITEQFEGMSANQRRQEVESICEYSKQVENILAGRTELPSNVSTEPKKSQFKAQLKKLAPVATSFCSEPSIENLLAMTKISFDQETRTCKVSIHKFSQRFKRSAASWSVISKPKGECGVVQLSKFEQEDDGIFWRYTARKAITNPDNETSIGLACDKLAEAAYPYSWEPTEKPVECDFIRY